MSKNYIKNKPVFLDIIFNIKSNNIRKTKHFLCNAPKLVFICGKSVFDKNNIKYSDDKLKKKRNKRFYIIQEFERRNVSRYKSVISILSEDLFSFCKDKKLDLLTFEEILAEVSFQIINIVESMGTACELGAFSIEQKYLDKMVVLNLDKFENDKSFINDGPMQKIRNKNKDNVIVVKSNKYYLCDGNKALDDYINKVIEAKVKYEPNNNSKKIKLISLIYELLNILDLFGKLRKEHLFKLYKYFKGFEKYEILNGSRYKIKVDGDIINFMNKIGLVDINGEYVSIKDNIRCEDALFTFNNQLEYECCKLKIKSVKSKEYLIDSLRVSEEKVI